MKQELLAIKLLSLMKPIVYGYLDHDKNKHFDTDDQFSHRYYLQAPWQLERSQIGVCWDQVEYERDFFVKKNLKCKTLAIVADDGENLPTHSMLYFKTDKQFCWLEHSWAQYRGLWYFDTEKALREKLATRFLSGLQFYYGWKIVQYDQPMFGINCDQYYQHLDQGIIKLQGDGTKITSLFDFAAN